MATKKKITKKTTADPKAELERMLLGYERDRNVRFKRLLTAIDEDEIRAEIVAVLRAEKCRYALSNEMATISPAIPKRPFDIYGSLSPHLARQVRALKHDHPELLVIERPYPWEALIAKLKPPVQPEPVGVEADENETEDAAYDEKIRLVDEELP